MGILTASRTAKALGLRNHAEGNGPQVTTVRHHRHLVAKRSLRHSSAGRITEVTPTTVSSTFMSDPRPPAKGADWTRLLADPDLVTHLAELLRTYRDSPPANRERALLEAVRKIKEGRAKLAKADGHAAPAPASEPPEPVATEPTATPPFEPSMFAPSTGEDRRRYPRMKCFVVVELRAHSSERPKWGNLANISLGGCFVETPADVESGAKIEIGLWVASGQIWVKGLILNGVVARTNPSFGIRIKFAALESPERETLRLFLRFVETSTKGYAHSHGYLAQLKR